MLHCVPLSVKGCSQYGNIMFPTWEHLVPLMGMGFEVEEEPANT